MFRKSVENVQVTLKSDKNKGFFNEDQYTFLIICRSYLLTLNSGLDKSCKKITLYVQKLFFFENHAVYEIMSKNVIESGMTQITIWCISIACWIPKATKLTLKICNSYSFSTAAVIA